jgi:response regulator RpfG family c-di-GMP phosphodiesterase
VNATVKPRVLCIDDEPNVLAGLALNLRREFDVVTATSGAEGLAMLANDADIAVIVSDMRMPVMNGATVLARALERRPEVTRLLLTGHADVNSAIAAVNDGQAYRFLTKPCPKEQLISELRRAVEHHRLVTAERVLLEQTLHGAVAALIDILSMTNPVTFGRASRIKTRAAALASALALEDGWQLEVAAMLQQIGLVSLPHETVEKLLDGRVLSEDEHRMLARMPAVTEQLLGHIPRLESVREILSASTRPPRPVPPDRETIERAGQILRVATDLDTLEMRGTRGAAAVEALRGRAGAYDEVVLDAVARMFGDTSPRIEVREIPIAKLRPGMVLAEDVKMTGGSLLVARGYQITWAFLARIKNFPDGAIRGPLRIAVTTQVGCTPG